MKGGLAMVLKHRRRKVCCRRMVLLKLWQCTSDHPQDRSISGDEKKDTVQKYRISTWTCQLVLLWDGPARVMRLHMCQYNLSGCPQDSSMHLGKVTHSWFYHRNVLPLQWNLTQGSCNARFTNHNGSQWWVKTIQFKVASYAMLPNTIQVPKLVWPSQYNKLEWSN